MRLLTSQKSAPKPLNPSLRQREKRSLATVIIIITTTMALVMDMDMVITMETMDMAITMASAMTMAIESRGAGRGVGVRRLAGTWGNNSVLSRWIWFMANSRPASRPCTWASRDDPLRHR